MEMLCILIWVVIMRTWTTVKTHPTECFRPAFCYMLIISQNLKKPYK